MLHICLLILKIIGIVLAALLGLIFLILLMALFVPVRYQGHLIRRGDLKVKGKVSWLMHIISVPVEFAEGELLARIRLFGITVKRFFEDREEAEQDAAEFLWDEEEEPEEKEEQNGKEAADKADTDGGQEAEGGTEERETSGESEESPEDKLWQPEEEADNPDEDSQKGFIGRILDRIRSFFLKIFGIWKKIKNLKYTFRKLCGKIRHGIRKYRDTKEFLFDERTKGALRQCWEQIKFLVRKLFPKKIRGELRFGTEDPALTGEILGGISIFYPIFMDNVKVYPDFEQSILEGELFVKGRFRLITILVILWKLWRDKNVRYVYRRLTGRRGRNA